MKKKNVTALFIVIMILLPSLSLNLLLGNSGEIKPQIQDITANKIEVKPDIDGELNDDAWKFQPIKEKFITAYPVRGDIFPFETLVWVSYDNQHLYFAFKCIDPEPNLIKTTLTKRDNIFDDDWVAVAIDAVGSGQTAYVLYVNPNGIQGDSLLSSSNASEDNSPDYVWQSAAKLTDTGYQVEICLPLKSITFKSGKISKMGLLFQRHCARTGFIASWPQIKESHNELESQVKSIFKGLKKPLKLELLPSVTYSNNRFRINPDKWGDAETDTQLGIGLKYGLTSSITAEFTVNPDFSQVESDAFQVQVNQRYPLFYVEKRPFFMEGSDIFQFSTHGFGYLSNPVYTRQIVDPAWGIKLTGEMNKMSFGFLGAGDEFPGQAWENEVNPYEGKQAFFGIVRGKYSLGKNNYMGFLYSGRELADQYNRVVGLDMSYRLGKYQYINGSFLHSFSRDEDGETGNAGNSNNFNFRYFYETKHLFMFVGFEHLGADFRMDSAYMKQNGLNFLYFQINGSHFPKSKKLSWIKRVTPDLTFNYLHDNITGLDDYLMLGKMMLYTSKNGFFQVSYLHKKEHWQGQPFKKNRLYILGWIRLNKWLYLSGEYNFGQEIYYNGNPSFLGNVNYYRIYFNLQPNEKLNQEFNYVFTNMYKDKKKVYDVNLIYSKTTFQFNKYFFLRSVIQYDSYEKRLLTDFLASFTLIPGSVIHVGYGGLYENRRWQDEQWLYRQGDFLNVRRSFFAKISYLWRF